MENMLSFAGLLIIMMISNNLTFYEEQLIKITKLLVLFTVCSCMVIKIIIITSRNPFTNGLIF